MLPPADRSGRRRREEGLRQQDEGPDQERTRVDEDSFSSNTYRDSLGTYYGPAGARVHRSRRRVLGHSVRGGTSFGGRGDCAAAPRRPATPPGGDAISWRDAAPQVAAPERSAESIRSRQDALAGLTDGPVFAHDLTPFAGATEALTGRLGRPHRRRRADRRRARRVRARGAGRRGRRAGRARGRRLRPARQHGGRARHLALPRRARRRESGGFRTHVLRDRMTRASAFLFDDAGQAVAFSRWIEEQVPAMQRVARVVAGRGAVALREAARDRDARRRPGVPRDVRVHDRRRGRAEHGHAQLVRAERVVRPRALAGASSARSVLEGNMGGDKKPSHRYFERGGHGKTVIAECTLTEEAIRRVLRTNDRRPARPGLRRHARRRRVGHAVGRVHARDGDRGDVHRDRPGRRHGRDELDVARAPPTGSRAACM